MSFGRYKEINNLLDGLLELPLEERAGFLERSCRGDTNLQNTVEALLAAYESEDGFLDVPALLQIRDNQYGRQPSIDLSGKTIGAYEILQPLGAGALAEVWLAEDKRLQRRIALKILRAKFIADSNHLLRFEQEARAASKLSHPNIVTIHETGTSGGFHFIAQEFVDGVTLRKRLTHGLLPYPSVLDIAGQVVAALRAAHNSGIIHRDIKPENLMIRTDGLIKVLDFGIARLIEGPDRNSDWRNLQDSLTTPGLILGTVKYMSPEQARGLSLDHRSDLFSFGVVLYEMLTGRPPFVGPTNADTLAAVLAEEPAPLSAYRPGLSPAFQHLVSRCLEKDRERRVSSAEELLAQLKDLALARDHFEAAIPLQNSSWFAPFKRLSPVIGAMFVIAVLFAWVWRAAHRGNAPLPFDSMEMTRLTLPGPISDAAIAPDGNNVAYILQGSDSPSVWIRQLSSAADTRILSLQPGNYQDIIYSPDGAYVYYVRKTNLAAAVYRIRLADRQAAKVLDNVTGQISFAPDGGRIAFTRLDPTRWQESLIVTNSDGRNAHVVTTRRRPSYYWRFGVAWSLDGKSIFCLAGKEPFYTPNAYHIVRVEIATGRETTVGTRSWARVGDLISAVRARMLIVGASEYSDQELQLWRVSYPDGHVTRITADLNNYAKLSLSANAQTLLAIRRERTQDLWTLPAANPDAMREISNGDIPDLNSAAFTKQGDVIYSASAGQFLNIWKMSAAGQNPVQITRANQNQVEVASTPDGRYILYQSGGKIWRINANGSDPRQLTNGNLDVHPVSSPDSQWVLYGSFQGWSPEVGGRQTIWRVPIRGGEPIQVTKDITSLPAVSPDGKLIAAAYFLLDKPQTTPKIAVYRFAGGSAIRIFDRPNGSDDKLYWSGDGSGLEYIVSRGDVSNIWRQPISGGPPAPITRFRAGRLFSVCPSLDGKQLILARGKELTGLVLISQAQSATPHNSAY